MQACFNASCGHYTFFHWTITTPGRSYQNDESRKQCFTNWTKFVSNEILRLLQSYIEVPCTCTTDCIINLYMAIYTHERQHPKQVCSVPPLSTFIFHGIMSPGLCPIAPGHQILAVQPHLVPCHNWLHASTASSACHHVQSTHLNKVKMKFVYKTVYITNFHSNRLQYITVATKCKPKMNIKIIQIAIASIKKTKCQLIIR